MCGITGIIANQNKRIALNTLEAMTQVIQHRGPDDEGFVLFDENYRAWAAAGKDTDKHALQASLPYLPKQSIHELTDNYKIGFGHRRLSILDLSVAGHMPMCSADEQIWITYNGEVYNYEELRKELQNAGYAFTTETDTEVIINAYRHWGKDCLNRFVGMFAFCLFDKQKQRLLLARDRFGIKPFYYWVNQDGILYFGSEIKQFTVCENWKPVLNKKQAFDFLNAGTTDQNGETLITGVYSLSPACLVEIDLNAFNPVHGKRLNETTWYNPDIKAFTGSYEQAVEQFKLLFDEAIKLHLRSDVLVGCTLSGGFDSSSITCVVNDLLKREGNLEKHNTFSAIDGDSKYSEKKWIETVVNSINVKAHYLTPNPEKAIQQLEHYMWMMDEPTGSMSPYLGYLVDGMAASAGIKVLLNGQGSDEYLSCYGELKRLRRLKALESLNIKNIVREYSVSLAEAIKMSLRALGRKSYQAVFGYKKYKQKFTNPFSARPWLNYINFDVLEKQEGDLLAEDQFAKSSYRQISSYQLFKSPLPMFLRWSDRNSMASSIEARVPFLDHRLVEFCHSLPLAYIDDENRTKKVLLSAMQGMVPDAILNRTDKMGYVAPEERWLKEEYVTEFKSLLLKSMEYAQGIIKPDAMEYYQEIIEGKKPFNFSIWRFIVFGFWMKRFGLLNKYS